MLSDEITTGAVKHSDSERKTLAAESHAWNAAQPKFRTLFPEYAGERMKDLPNMSGKAPEPAGPQGEGKAPPGVSLSFAFFSMVKRLTNPVCFSAEQLVNGSDEKEATTAAPMDRAATGSSPKNAGDVAPRRSCREWLVQLTTGRGLLALAVFAAVCAVALRHLV